MLQNMLTHRPSPRFSVEQLGIGKVVVYFLTAISVSIIWTLIHHVACYLFSSIHVGMCAGQEFCVCNSPEEDQDPQWILTGPE